MLGNGGALAIRVAGQVHTLGLLGGLLQCLEGLGLVRNGHVRDVPCLDVHPHLFQRQILDVPERCQDLELAQVCQFGCGIQVLLDALGLAGALDDDEVRAHLYVLT